MYHDASSRKVRHEEAVRHAFLPDHGLGSGDQDRQRFVRARGFPLGVSLRHGAGALANAAAALIGGIEGGLTYFNIHTVNNGGGEIRDELTAVPGPHRRRRTAGSDFGGAGALLPGGAAVRRAATANDSD
jgi:hypothetical protein